MGGLQDHMRVFRGATLFLVSTISTAAAQQTVTTTTSLVFDRVTVVDVEQGKLVPDQRVVIMGNRIEVVGGAGVVKTPKGAQVVDAKGKYLIPGLWDMHTHSQNLAHIFYPLFIANGVTGIRDAWSVISLDTLTRWRQEILGGTRVGPPRQILVGEALDDTVLEVAQRKVDSLKAHGANFIKTYPFTFALAAAARRAGLPFGGHLQLSMTAMEASDSGISILDHLRDHSGSTGGLDSLCWGDKATVERCQPVAERLKRNETWLVPTITRGHLTKYVMAPRSDAIYTHLAEGASKFWSRAAANIPFVHNTPPVLPSEPLGILHVMQRVGMPILAGTDAGAPVIESMPPGFALHAELAMYVSEGMSVSDALRTATLNPAKFLHGTDSLGTVTSGKLADLVLLDADPLADITNTTAIRAVVANGRYFDRAALDSLLTEVQAQDPRTGR